MTKWEIIDTAPTDRTEILGAIAIRTSKAGYELGGGVEIIRRCGGARTGDVFSGDIWIKRNGDIFCPTHWMPLPTSPVIK